MPCIFTIFLVDTMFSYDGIILNNVLFLWIRTHYVSTYTDIWIRIHIKRLYKLAYLNLYNTKQHYTTQRHNNKSRKITKNINDVTFKRTGSFHTFKMFLSPHYMVQHCHLDSWKTHCFGIMICDCTKVCNMLSDGEFVSDLCNATPIYIH